MTFAVVAASNTNKRSATGSAFSVSLPTGITAGDRLIIILGNLTSPTTPTGWTSIFSNSGGSGELHVYEKQSASGSEGSTVSVGGTGPATAISYRITGSDTTAATEISTVATGSINTNPDSGSLTPSWGALDTLWFSADQDQNGTATTTSYPASYSSNQVSSTQSGAGAVRAASRNLNATSDNPGAYTLSSTSSGGWQAITLAVKPGSAAVSYTLTAATGAFALSGVAATLRAARTLPAATGSFALTGIAAGLKHGYTLTAAKGTFSLTGIAAGLRRDLRLTTAVGSVALVGNAANLVAARRLTAGLGTVALTGVAAGLAVGRRLPAGTGTFSLTGYAAGLNVSGGYTLSAGTGAFVLTGNDAGLVYTPATNTYRPDPGGKSSRSDPRRKSRREQSRKRNEELTRQLAPAPPPDAPLVPVTRKAVKAALALPIATGWLLEDARQALPAYVPLIVGAEQYRAAAGVANASAAAAALAVAQYLARLRLEEEDEEDVMLLLSIAA